MRPRGLVVAGAVGDLTVEHCRGDGEDVEGGVVEQVARLGHPSHRRGEQFALRLGLVDL